MAARTGTGSSAAGEAVADDRNPASERRDSTSIRIRLDELLADRGLTLTELSERVGITVVNLSILKNGRARAIRFSTLAGLCAELGCQPGDLLGYEPDLDSGPDSSPGPSPPVPR
jgi:putative transcriptional regulator